MPNIIKKYELIMTEVKTNNNKVWRGILYDDGTGASEFGRVGYTCQTCSYPSHAVVEKKMQEKIKKGYTELQTINNTAINSSTTVKNADLHNIAREQIIKNKTNPVLTKLIDRLVSANIHKITSNTQITYNSTTGLFATPLGVVTLDGISKARNLLAGIYPLVLQKNYGDDLNSLVSKYLRLIPQNVGMKLNVRSLLPDENAVRKQSDLIDSLEASYQALHTNPISNNDDGNKREETIFKVDLDILQDNRERNRLERYFESSKKKMHGYDHIKVREIYSVNIHEMTNKYENNTSPHQEVFHGTSGANCLSILKGGLKVSPPSTVAITGKLYGNGVYGSTCSSKSIGYTFGRWVSGSGIDHGYLFICDFAMGNIFYPKTYSASKPNGYDSIWAKPENTGLHNDELIVYRNNQVKIKYLLEIK